MMAQQPLSEADHQAASDARRAADAEGWALLDGMRRRLDDQSTHARKTAAQVTQLAGSIAALVEDQRRRSRTLNLNSFVAYLIFTLLCCGGFYVLYHNRARQLVDARDRAAAERNAAIKRADQATRALQARQMSDATAWEAWQLLAAGRRSEAAKRIAELAGAKISPLDKEALATRLAELETADISAALKTATADYRSGRYAEAMATLDQALLGASLPNAETHYLYGLAAARAEQWDLAATHFRAALAGRSTQDDARLRLATALDRAGHRDEATVEYARFAQEHPDSASAALARSKTARRAAPAAEASDP